MTKEQERFHITFRYEDGVTQDTLEDRGKYTDVEIEFTNDAFMREVLTGSAARHVNDKPNRAAGRIAAIENALGFNRVTGKYDPTAPSREFRREVWEQVWKKGMRRPS